MLLDAIELVHIDVDDFGAVFEVVGRVVAVETAARREVAAAQDVGGLVEVDIALDIRRHFIGGAVGIVGDEQAHRDMRGLERLGKFHGGIAADGMADNGDRLGVAAVIVDGLIGDSTPDQVGVDVGRDAGAADALRQFVHAPIDQADQASEQIGACVRFGARRFGRRGLAGTDKASCDQERCDDMLG